MAQQNGCSTVSRVLAALSPQRPTLKLVQQEAQAASPLQQGGVSTPAKLTSEQMFSVITGGGRCLPG